MYFDQPIHYWPPTQNIPHPDKDVDALYTLLNPPTHCGNVEGTADERSFVYVTGGYEKPQAIVFVAFDPAIRLVGLKRWGSIEEGVCQKSVRVGQHIDERASSARNYGHFQALCNNVDEADRTVSVKRNGKGKERANHSSCMLISSSDALEDVQDTDEPSLGEGCTWAREESAMYRDIGIGYFFGLERSSGV